MHYYYQLLFEIDDIEAKGIVALYQKSEKVLTGSEIQALAQRFLNSNQNSVTKFLNFIEINEDHYNQIINNSKAIQL